MTSTQLVVGIDSSTQSCKVEIREIDTGRLVASGAEAHPPTFPPKSEQDPNMWWECLVKAFHKAVNSSKLDKKLIVAIAVTAQCHGMVVLDKNMNVIRPAKLWNDTESSLQSDSLLNKFGEDYWINLTGSKLGPSFTITKLVWLLENEIVNFKKINKLILPHDFLTWKLSSKFVTDRAGASCTGYYSIREQAWSLQALDSFDSNLNWLSILPKVMAPNEKSGLISPDVADQLGLERSVVIGAGTGDQMASSLGLGAQEGDYVVSIGTSVCVFTVSSKPIIDLSGLVNCVCDASGKFLPIVVGLNGTKVTNLVAKILNCDFDELSTLAMDTSQQEPRLFFSALIDGERSPNLPNATGTLAGMTSRTTRNGIARAAFDGVLIPVVKNYRYLKNLVGAPTNRIIIAGGGAKSYAYRQILADLIQHPITLLDVEESAARGACIQAAAVKKEVPINEILTAWAPNSLEIVNPREEFELEEYFLRFEKCSDWRALDRIES